MLVDAFLAASDVRERYAMFLPHKHKIREPDSVPDYGSDKDSYNSKSGYQTSTKTNESSDDKLEGEYECLYYAKECLFIHHAINQILSQLI
mmetsp:Transcript_15296/g.18931  ORF Transcript_15296/g.18931 Transcript_15296/m.18931 type:complete len:91 (+) Transcript_15296:253-525(+)